MKERETHILISRKTQKPHIKVEHNWSLNAEHNSDKFRTPTLQRVWEVIHNLQINAMSLAHSSGNNVPNGEKVGSSKGKTEGFVCSA